MKKIEKTEATNEGIGHLPKLQVRPTFLSFSIFKMNVLPSNLSATHKSVSIPADGNCFFRSVALRVYGSMDNHLELRKKTMQSLLRKKDSYNIYFETAAEFESAVRDCEADGKWNTDVIDLAPDVLSALLSATIIIHNYRTVDDTTDPPVVFSNGEAHKIELVRVYNCHYNLLIPKDEPSPLGDEDEPEAEAEADDDACSDVASVGDFSYDTAEPDETDAPEVMASAA